MITIVTNISREDNRARITTSFVSSTESGNASTGVTAVKAQGSVKEEVLRGISTAASQAVRLVSERFDKEVAELIGDMTDSNTLQQLRDKERELEDVRSQLSSYRNAYETSQQSLNQVQAEYAQYKDSVIAAARMLQGGNTVTIPVTAPAAPSNSTTTSLIEQIFGNGSNTVSTAIPRRVVLNAQVLNDAIRAKDQLESRTCIQCGNSIIAPASLHNAEIICARCHPQAVESIQPLVLPTDDVEYDNDECDNDCRNCDSDCDNRGESYHGWDDDEEF